MINIFVIGGNGFIGKHFIEELRGTDRKIFVVSRTFIEIDNVTHVTVQSLFDPILGKMLLEQADEIVCLFYASKPKTSFQNPVKDIDENLAQTVHLFELASQSNRLKKIVYISSGGTVYGNSVDETISESHITKPISPYGITKLAIEHYAYMYHVHYKLPIIIIRPSNAYGPGQFAKDGQGFIAYALHSIMKNKPVEIYGKVGTVRDYIYVKDLSKAIFACLVYGQPGKTYNAGTQQGYLNIDIVSKMKPLVASNGFEVKILHKELRTFDVNRNVLNIDEIRKDTGWIPTTDISSGLKSTFEWAISIKNNEDLNA